MTVRIKFDELLFKHGIRVPQAVEMTGLNRNTLYGLTTKRYNRIDLETLDKICKAFNCGITDIIEYVED